MTQFYQGLFKALLIVLAPFAACLSVSSQTFVYTENCNTLGGWTNSGGVFPLGTTGPQYEWHAVVPIIPAADHTGGGGGVFYTNGNSQYLQSGAGRYTLYQLTSPPINLSGWDNTRLVFWMQMRSETGNWDGGYVEWSHDGVNWTQILNQNLCLAYDGNMSQNPSSTPYFPLLRPAWWNPRTSWTRVVANISAWDNVPTFYIRYTFHSDEALADLGWALDDIGVVSVAIPQIYGNNIFIPHNSPIPNVPNGTDFGAVPIGQCVTHTFYMHNAGESPLTLTGNPYVTITGNSSFTVVSQPTNPVIPPGDSVAFDVQFCPNSVGNVTASVNIPTSDQYSVCAPPNPYNFAINGRNLNTPPVITGIYDTTVCPNGGGVVYNVTITDNEQNPNVVTLTGASSNQGIVPNGNIVFSGTGPNRTITITPLVNQSGPVQISITTHDGQLYNPDSVFLVNIFFGDNIPPVALCQNLTVQLDNSGNGSITPQQADNGSTDNCGITSLSLSQSTFTCADAGIIPVTLTVTDVGGNTTNCTFNVTVLPPALSATYTTSDYNGFQVSCAGASDGSITVSIQGGCPPVTYAWSHDPNQTTNAANGLAAGNYTITITDPAGQTVNLAVTLNEPPTLTDQSTALDISCFGQQDGQVQLAASGGVTPYSYSQGPAITGLPAGNYQYVITDANNCLLNVSHSIAEPPQILLEGVELYTVFCKEGAIFDITSGGGTGSITYDWEPKEHLTCSNCEDPVATPPKTTIYNLVITDERGCSKSMSVKVEVSCYAFIPNSFTPNEDGINDYFFVESAVLEAISIRIFSRWGEEVFYSGKLDYGWNGKKYNQGAELPPGTYAYAIDITLPGEMPVTYMGNVNLIR